MMIRIAATVASVAVLAVIGGTWYVTQNSGTGDEFAQCRTSVIAGGSGQIGGPFTLLDKTGAEVTEKDVITEPTLLYFGYTFCPDVCPLDTVRNAEAVDILQERGMSVTPVFISIDGKRDTPEVIGDFAEHVHEKMIGLTGSAAQIKAASQAYRTYYKAQPADDDYYLVDHSTFTYLVFPEQGFVDYFKRELTPEQMADQVACFVKAAS